MSRSYEGDDVPAAKSAQTTADQVPPEPVKTEPSFVNAEPIQEPIDEGTTVHDGSAFKVEEHDDVNMAGSGWEGNTQQ